MGIDRTIIKILSRVTRSSGLSGRVAVIGKQAVYATWDEARTYVAAGGVVPSADVVAPAGGGPIDDETLFRLFGFSVVDSFDRSPYEGAKILVDLNRPLGDEHAALRGSYDLVVDAGCTEHMFDVPAVLRNYRSLVRPGGVVAHFLPVANWVDHGLYMFSPGLYWDYYGAHGWTVVRSSLLRCRAYEPAAPIESYRYRPGDLEKVTMGGLDDRTYVMAFAAQRGASSVDDAEVQQRIYREVWAGADADAPRGASVGAKQRVGALVQERLPGVWRRWLLARSIYLRARGPAAVLAFEELL